MMNKEQQHHEEASSASSINEEGKEWKNRNNAHQESNQESESEHSNNTTLSSPKTASRIKPKLVYSLQDESDDNLKVKEYTDDMINKMMSGKLNKMTVEERNHAIHEVHGVADDVTETFEDLVSKLQEMDKVLSELENEETTAYRKARELNVEYVERIKIFALRADDYDPQKAAARLVSFFTFKNQLFGSDKLAREIVMDDLDFKDMECYTQGTIQILKERDRSGRTVVVMIGQLVAKHEILHLSRIYFYVNMVAMRDETTRKKGVVFILYSVDMPQDFAVNRAEKLARVLWLLPVKIVAAHYCYDGLKQMLFEKALSTAMETFYLCRFRSHYVGSHSESAYKLSAFGIPSFVSSDGNFDIQWIKYWIDNTKAQEKLKFHCGATAAGMNKEQTFVNADEVRSSSSVQAMSVSSSFSQMKKQPPIQLQQPPNQPIMNPGPLDLVVRKGRYSKDSEGYKQFRSVLANRFDEYENAGYGEKWIIADAVLADLKSAGCRFIKRTKQPQGGDGSAFLFEECDDTESREKIGHAFRTLRKTSK